MSISARFIVFAACSTLAVPLALVHSAGAGAAGDPKLSQGRVASASSARTSLGAALAVDGKTTTRWASAAGTGPQWIRIDLGAVSALSRVSLDWSSAYAKAYRIETSTNGLAWTTIFTTAAGNGGIDNLTGLSGQGRYVRLSATKASSTQGYSVKEFKVYGSGSGIAKPVEPMPAQPGQAGLSDPAKKDLAMRLVSSAENSSLDWRGQFGYIEDIGDGRGYTGGIVGFCSGTDDMLKLVELYTARVPGNVLAKYLPALRKVNGSASHAGLAGYPADWRAVAKDPAFSRAQEDERDRVYFDPAVKQGKSDGLRALGQFIYYDAIVMHGPGSDSVSFGGIRSTAMGKAKTPAQGGDETAYLNAFLDARAAAMRTEEAHSDTSRVDTAQRVFLKAGNLDLTGPLSWKVYGDPFTTG